MILLNMFFHSRYAISCVAMMPLWHLVIKVKIFSPIISLWHDLIILPINKLVIVHLEVAKFMW